MPKFQCPVEKWSPALQIRTVLLSIQALLSAPNPDDPLANDVAEQWKVNEAQAIETGTCFASTVAFNSDSAVNVVQNFHRSIDILRDPNGLSESVVFCWLLC
jgi:hypothetical protein